MVIDNFDIVGIGVNPTNADSPLAIDPNSHTLQPSAELTPEDSLRVMVPESAQHGPILPFCPAFFANAATGDPRSSRYNMICDRSRHPPEVP